VHVSSGAACSAGTTDPSAVVRAMVGDDRARGALRVSLGPGTGPAEIDRIVSAFDAVLARG
jgi:cysteine desulfurase